jgi:hypothetical protein
VTVDLNEILQYDVELRNRYTGVVVVELECGQPEESAMCVNKKINKNHTANLFVRPESNGCFLQ